MAELDLTNTQELLMTVIEHQRLYGLEISESIDKATQGQRKIPVGSLYPILKRLENRGFVSSEWGDATESREGARRKYYSLTDAGKAFLNKSRVIRESVISFAKNDRN